VKDQFETKGIPTTAGSTILADYVPEGDATAVARAKDAGAILLGKLNMTEFAAGMGDRFKYGEPKNPWNQERTPGSSSTGSAVAIAASLCAISLGEDTGGSGRGPASHCGIVGFRPTWGRVSRYGLLPVCWSMDAAGPMTRTVEDAALILNVIAGYDPKDPLTSKLPVPDYTKALGTDLRGIRVGLIQEFMEEEFTNAEVLQALKTAATQIEKMGAVVERVSLPLLAEVGAVGAAVSGADMAFAHREWLQSRPGDYGHNLRRRLLAGSLIPSQVLLKAERLRAALRREWLKLFEHFDVLLSPTLPAPAEKVQYGGSVKTREEAELRFGRRQSPTMPAALAGTPAMSVPCGFSSENLPIGLQIMSSHFREEMVLRVGHAYEQSTTWHTRRPSL
jgi:aspartyl-tRNA(Asn)/glutamyl-tRNA(Gln) amidotransferase subunit A